MNFLSCKKVLCLSPHPDDVEYAISGTIKKCNQTKFESFCFSISGRNDKTATQNRYAEVKNFWKVFNCKNLSESHSSECYIQDKSIEEWIQLLENMIHKNKFDCVLIPSGEDSHNDHKYINSMAESILRTNNANLIEYKTPSTLNNWIPNLYVDVTKFIDNKIECLYSSFNSQNNKIYFDKENIKNFHINFQCLKKKLKYVEQFKIIRYNIL